MSKVRVLVGTRKGAFILYVRWKSVKKWDVSVLISRMGDLSPQGIPADPNRLYASQNQRLVRPGYSTL